MNEELCCLSYILAHLERRGAVGEILRVVYYHYFSWHTLLRIG